MAYRVLFTLVTGFALLLGSVRLGQAAIPIEGTWLENGAATEQTNSQAPADANSQPPNTADSTAIARWWQRFTPPVRKTEQAANETATAAAPAPQLAANAAESTWYFGKLFKRTDENLDRTDPFAVKTVSYEEPNPYATVLVAESADPTNSALTPPPGPANPWAAPASDSLAATSANGCPYPDTGVQTLYQPPQGASETTISDRAATPAQPPSVANVRGAFNGLLGHDDARTQQEAASLPLLSPYKDLPVGYPQTAAAARSTKQNPSASRYGKKAVTETEKLAPSSSVAQNPSDGDNLTTHSKKETVVAAAFASPLGDAKSQAATVQTAATAPAASATSNQSAIPQPLQLNGVEANQLTGSPLNRPKFIYHPASSVVDNAGHKVIKPEVRIAADSVAGTLPTSVQLAQFAEASEGALPAPANIAPETAYPIDDQQWMPPMAGFDSGACDSCQDSGHDHGWHGRRNCCTSGGLGTEHVMQAPFFIQTSQPFNNCRVRMDLAQNLEFPDRAEYFWAKTPGGKGPGPDLPGETSVNYQDLNFYIEKGFKRFSIGTSLPIRAVDPDIRLNTTGFSDMDVRLKTVLMDGTNWQLTQLFNTYLPTGSVSRGTGNGHVSLEPGVAYRWKWSDWTYFHGDLKYLFPIGADPDFSGQVFNYGIGISHVWLETDTWALIPTFEIQAWTFVDGRETLPNAVFTPEDPGPPVVPAVPAAFRELDSVGILNVCPGLRWVCDKGCDCGTKEFGISAGVAVTSDHLYEQILRMEFRWSH